MKNLVFFVSLFACIINAFSAKVDTVFIQSKCMKESIPNLVITPDNYSKQKEGYPVLYLLHGATNNYTEWTRYASSLSDYSDKYNFIVVCPDGGSTSWYFDNQIDPIMKYETYISSELVNYIDANYWTIPNRSKRAIAGLNMGGHELEYWKVTFKYQFFFFNEFFTIIPKRTTNLRPLG